MSPNSIDFTMLVFPNHPDVIILKNIALNGDSTKYSVEKHLKEDKKKLSHGTIYKVFDTLIEKGYIEEKSRKKGRNPNLETITYQITFKGLSVIYRRINSSEFFENNLPEKYSPLLPLIFGKWNQFKKKGLEKVAEERLKSAIGYSKTEEEINESFYLDELPTDPKTLRKWKGVLRDDPDIGNWVIERLKPQIEKLDKVLREKQELRKFLAM